MSREPIHHPIQAAIEDIWSLGHTPRLQIDARREDVVVPEFVKSRWGARLVLDLDATWPLNFEATKSGLGVDLAFQGIVTRCTLPWESIYVVLDRSTGRGIAIETHMPADGAGEEPKAAPRATLRQVAPLAEEKLEPKTSETETATKSTQRESVKTTADASTEEEARRRRARFKVIDGGQ
jgi:stringent starvation protein B